MKKDWSNTKRRGFSLIEVLLGVALLGIMVTALVSTIIHGEEGSAIAGSRDRAVLIAEEGIEAVISIKDEAWNILDYSSTGLDIVDNKWELKGEATSDTIDGYTRVLTFEEVCRDVNDEIAPCPAEYTDISTKKVTSTVTWDSRPNLTSEVVRMTYLTNWDGIDWTQTDWVGGSGQSIWSDETKFNTDDGKVETAVAEQVTLKSTGGSCGKQIWPFDSAGSYTYDSAKIEVVSSMAQLIEATISESTLNSGFDTNANNWTYNDWNQTGGEVDVTGSWNAAGGNPGGWIDVNFPIGKADEVGGYWEQSFTTTVNNPTTTCNFDWIVDAYDATPNTFQLYVFLDSSSGEPTIGQEVWSSGEQTSTTSWTSSGDVDCSSKVGAAGTYYFKVAVWLETPNTNMGPFEIGYDNASVTWETSEYATDKPDIYPVSSYDPDVTDAWFSFEETATKNGGEIYYQLSDDDGATWYYWNGSAWTTVINPADYNIATDINTNINTFTTANSKILFKAFLESDGSQLVQLDEVSITCEQYNNWPFDTAGNYTYDSGKIEVTGGAAKLIEGGASCGGIADACDTFGASGTCTAQSGCSWDPADCSGTPTACSGQGAGSCATCGCTYSPGGCTNIGLCSLCPGNAQCGACAIFGCSWFKGNCTGTLDCTTAADESSCTTCDQCSWAGAGGCSGTPSICTSYGTEADCNTCGCGWDAADCFGTATTCDTYGDETNCNTQSGCTWTGASYPSDSPTIQPATSFSESNLDFWTSFTETATKNGGEIYYQLSYDNGTSWYYWTGAAWAVVAGATDYNIATDINDNITTFPNTNTQILFKAFLVSDGTQLIELDNIRIGYAVMNGGGGSGTYELSGSLESSAYDMGDISAVQEINWDQVIDDIACPTCEIKFQLRSAPDATGSPGTWTNWYGDPGDGDYYTDNERNLVNSDLNGNQWVQYRVELIGDGANTPLLEEVRVNYKP